MDRSRCRWCRSLNVIAVRVLVVVVLRRVLCEVSAGTLASRCGTMCARAPAQKNEHDGTRGSIEPEASGGYSHPSPRSNVL